MITNSKKIQEFEKRLVRSEKVDVAKNFKIAEAMYREAVELHAIPARDPLCGIEIDIKIAKVVNSV